MNAWELFLSKIKRIKSISSDGIITFETDVMTEEEAESLTHLRMNAVTGHIFDDREVNIS